MKDNRMIAELISEFVAQLEKQLHELNSRITTVLAEPEASEPEAAEPEASEPEAAGPEAAEPEAAEPEASEPEAAEPETAEPEASEPEASEPEAAESEAAEPEAAEPEASEPEASEPEASEPEASEPEVAEPEAAESEATEPEAAEPEAAEPEDTDLEKYLAEEARFWEDRQNDEAFAKADKEERERQAMEVVGRAYKMLTSKQFGFSGNEAAEVILECPLLEKRGFTSDEARSLVASYLETAQ